MALAVSLNKKHSESVFAYSYHRKSPNFSVEGIAVKKRSMRALYPTLTRVRYIGMRGVGLYIST